MKKNYTVTTPEKLRTLCIRKNWFTCGSNEQYDKLFYANEHGCTIEEIATIIWLCSECEGYGRRDILWELNEEQDEYLRAIGDEMIDLTRGQYGSATFKDFWEEKTMNKANNMQTKKVFSVAKYLCSMVKMCDEKEIQYIIIPAVYPDGRGWRCDGKTPKECHAIGYPILDDWCIEIPQNENIDFWRNYSN